MRSSRSECARLLIGDVQPAEPVRLVRARPQRAVAATTGAAPSPRTRQSVDRVADIGLDLGAAGLARWGGASAAGCASSPAIAANSFWKASVKRSTPSAVSLSVISSSEIPSSSSAASVSRAPATSCSRLARGRPWRAEGLERRRGHGVDGVGPDQLLHVHERRGTLGFFVLGARPQQPLHARLPAPRAPSSGRRRCLPCSAGRRASRSRSRPCPAARARGASSEARRRPRRAGRRRSCRSG